MSDTPAVDLTEELEIGQLGVKHAKLLARRTTERVNNGIATVQIVHYLNKRLNGLTRGSISGLLAMPKHMKSTIIDSWISSSVEHFGSVAIIFSLEDTKEDRVKRMIASRLGISLKEMRFQQVKLVEEEVLEVLIGRFGGRLFVLDKREASTADKIVEIILKVKPDLFAIDHLQKFVLVDMVTGIKNAIDKIEHAALITQSHGIIASQVTDKITSRRENKRPTSSDSQWNSALYQSATELFGLYYPHKITKNDFDAHILELEILESRYSGAGGIIKLHIDPDQSLVIGESEYS